MQKIWENTGKPRKNFMLPNCKFSFRLLRGSKEGPGHPGGGIVTEAHPDRSPLERPGTFMGQGRAVKPRPDGNPPACQGACQLLAVPPALEGQGHGLVGSGKHPEAPLLQPSGTELHLPVPPAENCRKPQPLHKPDARRQPRRPGHIHSPRLQALGQTLGHGFQL